MERYADKFCVVNIVSFTFDFEYPHGYGGIGQVTLVEVEHNGFRLIRLCHTVNTPLYLGRTLVSLVNSSRTSLANGSP